MHKSSANVLRAICLVAVCAAASPLLSSAVGANAAGRTETPGGVVHTWSNFRTAAGKAGALIPSHHTVTVACRVRGFKVADGDRWWYRIASSPWKGRYYASADAFYNNGRRSGSLIGTPLYDPKVVVC